LIPGCRLAKESLVQEKAVCARQDPAHEPGQSSENGDQGKMQRRDSQQNEHAALEKGRDLDRLVEGGNP
jgi:hypothetical protein